MQRHWLGSHEGFSIKWQTGQVRQWNVFVILLLYGDLQGGSLLNLANPVQNPHFFWRIFPKISRKKPFVLVAVPKRISHFGEISRKKKKKKQQRCAGVKILWGKKFQHADTGSVKVI
jgi:hypothetical protein